jgi:hypothetical protein
LRPACVATTAPELRPGVNALIELREDRVALREQAIRLQDHAVQPAGFTPLRDRGAMRARQA